MKGATTRADAPRPMTLTDVRDLVGETFKSFSRHSGTLLGGATAFFALLSAAPLLIIALAIAGSLTSAGEARAELMRGMNTWLGPEGAHTVDRILADVRSSHSGKLASGLSIAVVIYGSTRLFSQMQRALNHMWDVHARSGRDLRRKAIKQVKKRLLAFVMVLLCAFVLLGSVLVRAALTAASRMVGSTFYERWHVVDQLGSFAVIVLLFALLFKVLPDVRIAWRDAWTGAVVTAALFTVGKLIVSAYLGHKSFSSTFGAAGSLVLLLLWGHYSAQIFYLGAAFTAAWAHRHGRTLEPTENASRITMPDEPD